MQESFSGRGSPCMRCDTIYYYYSITLFLLPGLASIGLIRVQGWVHEKCGGGDKLGEALNLLLQALTTQL